MVAQMIIYFNIFAHFNLPCNTIKYHIGKKCSSLAKKSDPNVGQIKLVARTSVFKHPQCNTSSIQHSSLQNVSFLLRPHLLV